MIINWYGVYINTPYFLLVYHGKRCFSELTLGYHLTFCSKIFLSIYCI